MKFVVTAYKHVCISVNSTLQCLQRVFAIAALC